MLFLKLCYNDPVHVVEMLLMFQKVIRTLSVIMMGLLVGCTVTSGLSVGDLPTQDNGTEVIPTSFVADNGVFFSVQELTAHTIPPYNPTSKRPNTNVNVRSLVRAPSSYAYKIAKGDVLNISLPAYPEVTPQMTYNNTNPYAAGVLVDQEGFIQFPLIGRIKVLGMTTTQLTNTLNAKLGHYLKYPDAQVRVLNYRGNKFYIGGQVKNPGQYDIADQPVSIYEAMSLAGGSNNTADTENVSLTRQGRVYHLGLRSLQNMGISPHNIIIQHGDSIHIGSRENNKVYVVGEFGKPNPVAIPEDGISLSGILGEANGLNSATANAGKIYILRENYGQNTASIYHLNLKTITNFSVANRFIMQPDDIVYVDPTGLARWNRVVNLLLPSASAVNFARGL